MIRDTQYEIQRVQNGWILRYGEEVPYEKVIYNKKGDVANRETRTQTEYHDEVFVSLPTLFKRIEALERNKKK